MTEVSKSYDKLLLEPGTDKRPEGFYFCWQQLHAVSMQPGKTLLLCLHSGPIGKGYFIRVDIVLLSW